MAGFGVIIEETIKQVAVHAETYKTTLALEPLNRFEIYLLNSAADTSRPWAS